MAKEPTEQDFADAQAVIDGRGVAYIAGRTATTDEELDFIRDAVEGEKAADVKPSPRPAFPPRSPAPVPGVEILTQPLTEAEMMAVASGTPKTSSPRAKAASVSQAQTGENDGNADGTTGPVGAEGEVAADLPVADAVRQALAEAGLDTPEKVAAASDEQLLAVPGVGQATIAKLRASG